MENAEQEHLKDSYLFQIQQTQSGRVLNTILFLFLIYCLDYKVTAQKKKKNFVMYSIAFQIEKKNKQNYHIFISLRQKKNGHSSPKKVCLVRFS